MEFAGGQTLHELRNLELSEGVVAAIMKYSLRGLDNLHKRGIMHRDLKANNVLMCMDGALKICKYTLQMNVKLITPILVMLMN